MGHGRGRPREGHGSRSLRQLAQGWREAGSHRCGAGADRLLHPPATKAGPQGSHRGPQARRDGQRRASGHGGADDFGAGEMSGFSPAQLKKLTGKLDRAHVQSRTVDGRQLDYIEGWFALSEANAIFGYANWDRETVHFERLFERTRGEL